MAVGTGLLDFGSTPAESATLVVTGQAGIGSTSNIEAYFMRESTASNGVDEHEEAATMIALVVGSVIAGTGFTIYANTIGPLVIGTFNVRWVWI